MIDRTKIMENSDVYWDNKWKEFLAQDDNQLSFAVLCSKCRVTCSVCDCRKKLWIDEEKNKIGIPVENPYICYECKNGTFSGRKCYHADADAHVTICDLCYKIAYSNDNRHEYHYKRKMMATHFFKPY